MNPDMESLLFAYLMDLFAGNHRQLVLVWRWAAAKAMIFESAEICAEVDVADAVQCNYNPYFMVVVCALELMLIKQKPDSSNASPAFN